MEPVSGAQNGSERREAHIFSREVDEGPDLSRQIAAFEVNSADQSTVQFENLQPRKEVTRSPAYRADFATKEEAYAEAIHEFFATLDQLEERLGDGREFPFVDRCAEADVRLLVTFVRFYVVYHSLFKCNLRRIADYPALSRYQKRILAVPGVRDTVSTDHIRRGYYSIKALNPTGIVPLGPEHPLG